jgi:hypothetical protein
MSFEQGVYVLVTLMLGGSTSTHAQPVPVLGRASYALDFTAPLAVQWKVLHFKTESPRWHYYIIRLVIMPRVLRRMQLTKCVCVSVCLCVTGGWTDD